MLQKQAAGGMKDYALSGGIGAAGGGALGSLIGALVQYARGKNVLRGALAGGSIGGGLGLLGGLGYQYSKKAPLTPEEAFAQEIASLDISSIKPDIPFNHNLKRNWGATARNKIRSAIKNTGSTLSNILGGSANSAKNGLDSLLNAASPKNWTRGSSSAQNAVDNAVNWEEIQEAGRDDPFYAWAVGEEEKEKTNRMNEQAKKNYKGSFEDKQNRSKQQEKFKKSE